MGEKVFIAGAKRTAIGSFLGQFQTVSASDLGATAVRAALLAAQVAPETVDEVILGNVLAAGQGQGVARQVALKAGCPDATPASAVNMVCGSGLKAVMTGFQAIKSQMTQVVVAGGTESMSQAPYLLPGRSGHKLGDMTLVDSLVADGLTDAFSGVHMGITAENVAETYGISRKVQDDWAFLSQQRAAAAQAADLFTAEIAPVNAISRKETVTLTADEYLKPHTRPEKLAALRPAFKKGGTVTAGNASGINDGASATVLVGEKFLKEHTEVTPLVEIVGLAQVGVDPQLMGMGPVPAIQKVLAQTGLTLADIDTLEINEAFASQSVAVLQELARLEQVPEEILIEKTNPTGGAIALGHPIGASGNRILVTLIHRLLRDRLDYGLASLCVGGGMGLAVIVRRV